MNKTVLVIDDDDMLRKTLSVGLRKEGFDVVTASSAIEGEDVLSRLIVDAIVLDRMMQGKDGLTFLKELRKKNPRTPVIMLTALGGPENAIAGLSGGANDYLTKPFQLRELVLRLDNIIKANFTNTVPKLPNGITLVDNDFFVSPNDTTPPMLLALSDAEKKLMQELTTPTGNIVPAAPMVAKRLRNKINSVLSDIDIITIRGRGYKLVQTPTPASTKGE